MTIIVALHDPKAKCTWIGADRLISAGGPLMSLYHSEKWSRYGDWAAGMAGNFRTNVLVQNNAEGLFSDLSGEFEFTNRLKALFIEDGYSTDTDEGPKSYGGSAILVNASGVWSIGPCFEVQAITPSELYAEGSGRKYAFGAATALQGGDAETIVRKAVEAAIRYDPYCGGEPWIERLDGHEPTEENGCWFFMKGVT